MCIETRICELEEASSSSRQLAQIRMDSFQKCKKEEHDIKQKTGCDKLGLANEINDMLQQASKEHLPDLIRRLLKILQNVTIHDKTLSEEIQTSNGFRECLKYLIQTQTVKEKHNGEEKDYNDDDDVELWKSTQKLATSIEASMSKLETCDKMVPFSNSELQSRLPLIFGIPQRDERHDDLKIMIHLVTSELETDTHDTGYVMWPCSMILARYLTENPSLVLDTTAATGKGATDGDILELGAGCGLVGLTAAAIIRQYNEEMKRKRKEEEKESKKDCIDEDSSFVTNNSTVILTDYLPMVRKNMERNLDLNGFTNDTQVSDNSKDGNVRVASLDFFDQPGNYDSQYDACQPNWIDMDGIKQPQVGLILASEVLPYSNDAINVANTIYAALVEGGKAIVVTANESKRFGVEDFPTACRNAGLNITMARTSVEGLANSIGEDVTIEDEFLDDLSQTVGYNTGYDFVIFKIDKPFISSGYSS